MLQEERTLRDLPIVVFTGKELTPDEQASLRTMAKSIVLKDVRSPERLLDETSLFLHRVVSDLPEHKRKMLDRLHGSIEVLQGRKVLVVDDDARNIFALTTVLESQEMDVLSATNGRQAIEIIQNTPDLSVVLMDIMMPEMDGYQTMREIRRDERFRSLPILALTAKAMKGDREKCLEAGGFRTTLPSRSILNSCFPCCECGCIVKRPVCRACRCDINDQGGFGRQRDHRSPSAAGHPQ